MRFVERIVLQGPVTVGSMVKAVDARPSTFRQVNWLQQY